MFIDNITITSDSEIGYHIYINYSDIHNNYCDYNWCCRENLDEIFDMIKNEVNKIKLCKKNNGGK